MGQTISKQNLWSPQFSQKTNKMLISFVFWRIEETINCFRDSLIFSSAENIPNAPVLSYPCWNFFRRPSIYIRVHRIDVKEREDPADCLDNDLQQIFGSVISPDLEIMKQEEEKLEGHCRVVYCVLYVVLYSKQQYEPEKMTARRGNNEMNHGLRTPNESIN